ncbi:MAG: hypothetical protein QOJ54_3433, partial [Aliidongia sp.]|nr:hypothetical protein [Aliidongia sp.]
HIRCRMEGGLDWFPLTFAHIGEHLPLELFARAQSARFFAKIRPLLGAKDLETLKVRVAEFDKDEYSPRFDYHKLCAARVMDIGKIATIP